jgi:hypothetical protein
LVLKASGRAVWGFFVGREDMIFYCPHCWKELPDGRKVCPHCRQNISSWDVRAFTDKLLQALSHPEPMTQTRAVYILGEKRATEALGALTRLFRQSKNPFLQSEIIDALGKIGGSEAVSPLIEALYHPSFIVRGEAAKVLVKFPGSRVVKRALERTLKDPSSYVREIGKQSIERLQSAPEQKGE